MAVGDGGFSTRAMGFDKNEVNEYIASLRKRVQEIEAEKKANDEKTKQAIKTAETADARVQEAVKAGEEKAAQLELNLSNERRNSENLQELVNNLKAKINEEKQRFTDALKSGKGVNEEAKNAYSEVIEKANADAKEIIDNAKSTADKIIAEAQSRRAEADESLNRFMTVFREQIDIINGSYAAIGAASAEVLGAEMPSPVEAPTMAAVTEAAKVDYGEPKTAPEVQEVRKESPAAAHTEVQVASVQETAHEEPQAEQADSEPVDFGGWDGNEIAQSILDVESAKAAPESAQDDGIFGGLFGTSEDSGDDMLSSEVDEILDSVKPLDAAESSGVTLDNDFANDLISQTMTSAHLSDTDDQMLVDAIKQAEEKFAVKPTTDDLGNFSMDDTEAEDSAVSDEEELMKALRDAEATLGGFGGASTDSSGASMSASSDSAEASSDDPWADLQKQLEAMEQAGNFGDTDLGADTSESAAAPAPAEPEPSAPSADDSAIWNFGNDSTSDSSDDDMSSDMFGSFGGF